MTVCVAGGSVLSFVLDWNPMTANAKGKLAGAKREYQQSARRSDPGSNPKSGEAISRHRDKRRSSL